MSSIIETLVETSSNMGILTLGPECMEATTSVRSSVGSAKQAVANKIQYLTEFLGGDFAIEGEYPAWEYRRDSALRDLMVDVYEDMFHKKLDVKVIHAGLECGILFEKIPDLDCVSFGPDMFDIHTTEERLSISSTKRIWEYTCEVLKRMK